MNNQKLIEIRKNIEKVIIGKSENIDLILTSLLAGGHVLLDDVPGTGKTVLSKSLAKSIDAEFNRIQFTPDLLPSDVTGMNYYNQKESTFVLRKGPAFCNLFAEYDKELSRAEDGIFYLKIYHRDHFDKAEITQYILSLGSSVVVMKPEKLRTEIIETIKDSFTR